MKLTIDFETRSTVDLKKAGAFTYAEDDTTDVLCLALKPDNENPCIWLNPMFNHLTHKLPTIVNDGVKFLIQKADIIEAHNAQFELAIWQVMERKYGMPPLPLDKMRCSAAKAAAMSIPRSLGMACAALGLEQQKDKEGHRVMLQMCKPRKPRKAERTSDPDWESKLYWYEDDDRAMTLFNYCIQDVVAEEELSSKLPELPPLEQEIWQLDYQINSRGITVDCDTIRRFMYLIADEEAELLSQLSIITDGTVSSPRQVASSLEWIKDQGVTLPNLQKQTLSDALESPNMPYSVRRFIEIRQKLGLSSVAKMAAMLDRAGKDGRIRDLFMYHGANTGRWAGRGVQLQNLPRGDIKVDDVTEIVTATRLLPETFTGLYGSPAEAAKSCIRGMIKAADGNVLYCTDYKSIEGRVLAWIANEDTVLDDYRDGKDMYKIAAAPVYGVSYDEVTPDQRQIGKVIELACGYQGYVGAFNSMAGNYGVVVDEEVAGDMIKKWRSSRRNTVSLWYALNDMAIKCIQTGKVQSYEFAYGRIQFGIRGDFLHMKLPSGRMLAYNKPSVVEVEDLYGRKKDGIMYMGMDSMTNRWCSQKTYGGKLTENAVQAIARDILAEAMVRLDRDGWDIVSHVHDEVVCEVPVSIDTDDNFCIFNDIVAEPPDWADGLPLEVDGWRGMRYRKD